MHESRCRGSPLLLGSPVVLVAGPAMLDLRHAGVEGYAFAAVVIFAMGMSMCGGRGLPGWIYRVKKFARGDP
jgi:hypothetical protein